MDLATKKSLFSTRVTKINDRYLDLESTTGDETNFDTYLHQAEFPSHQQSFHKCGLCGRASMTVSTAPTFLASTLEL